MRIIRTFFFLLTAVVTLVAYNNCGGNGFENALPATDGNVISGSNSNPLPITGTEPNVMKISVGCGYINEPCVSVTICEAGSTTNCTTIPDILLDTGSFGLRLFSSALGSLNLANRTIAGGNMAECVGYADGTSQWGPVKTADVVLGQRRASSIAVHVIDSTFPGVPSATCTKLDTTPANAGYNGILGVGVFVDDCGAGCATIAANKMYYSCNGTTCTNVTVPIEQQVSNPVALLPTDNNGVAIQLPSIPSSGTTSLSGWLVLGIGTQSNNIPSGATLFQTDGNGNFPTIFNGQTYSDSFIDSGSNGLFFPGSGVLPNCSTSGIAAGFFCPASATSLTAYHVSAAGGSRVSAGFQIMNAEVAFATSNPNIIFNNVGGNMSSSFDWGFPFYTGRTIFTGIDGKSSSLGTGPYWAY